MLLAARRSLALLLLCLTFCGLAAPNTARAQASVGVLRATAAEAPSDLSEAIDAALLRDLAQVAGIEDPVVSPIDVAEIQLSVGCADEERACLEAMAGAAGVSALVVRSLRVTEAGVELELLYFDSASSDEPKVVHEAVPTGSKAALIDAVPRLVRELFGIPEVAEAAEPVAVEPVAVEPHEDRAPPAAMRAGAHHDDSTSLAPWLLVGAGSAALTVGIVVGAVAADEFNSWKSRPIRSTAEADEAHADFDDLETRAIAADLSMLGGAVLLAVGVSWLAVELGESDDRAHATLRIVPSATGATLSFQGVLGEGP